MKRICISIVLLFSFLLINNKSYSQDEFPVLEGSYLGQKPPGLTAEVFAPGIVSTEHWEGFGVFTPDLKEFYFDRDGGKYKKHTLLVIKYENNRWSESVVGPRVGEPFISPDGKTMHLGRRYMERTDAGWSEVKSLGAPFKDIRIMRLSASSKGTYFFDEAAEIGNIRYSRLIDGKREKPQKMSKSINSGKLTAHPFIAPDESYLIWDAERDGGYGGPDLYISYRAKDGSWGPAINMGPKVNSDKGDYYATVTPDGKYILFNRSIDRKTRNTDIYWVDAQIIETLRPE